MASYDDTNGIGLNEDNVVKVYLLDEILNMPSSCDALYIGENELFIIEFKNREYKELTAKDKRDIRKKAYYTPEFLLNCIFRDWAMEDLAKHTTLLVVFKNMLDKEESFGKITDKLNRWANRDVAPVKCKLAKFKEVFYKDVYTIGKEEFEEKFLQVFR